MKGSLLIVGDFNIYVDVPIDPLAVCLSALLDNHSLHQSVPFPTHLKGHTLDLVLTKHDNTILQYTEPNFFLDVSIHSCEMSAASHQLLIPLYTEARNINTSRHGLQARLLNFSQLSAD